MASSEGYFERYCRLCAKEQDVTIMIFSKEAEDMFLQNKLNKYFLIEVDEDDQLPKNICIQCCSKLQTVCEFIDMARKAQDTWQNQIHLLEQGETSDTRQKSNVFSTNVELVDYEDTHPTKMEVNVDPLMVLEGSDDTEETEDNADLQGQDVSYLHGVDGEDVTIKLIKKGSLCDALFKPFHCTTCNRGFSTDFALKSHTWKHFHEHLQYECTICEKKFEYKNEYLLHNRIHKIRGKCKLCGRIFKTKENLEQHIKDHSSTTANQFICKICGRSYNTKSNLRVHSVSHSNERPFKCSYCKKNFKRSQDLKFHQNQHTGAKPYKCQFCNKAFASSGNCYSHKIRMHPEECTKLELKKKQAAASKKNVVLPTSNYPPIKVPIKYQCNLCEHRFLNKDNYTYHMYQHTGEKPFQCSFCDEKFVSRNGLSLHHAKSHPEKERPLSLLSKNAVLK